MRARPLIAHILPWDDVGGTEHATLRIAKAAAPEYSSILYCRESAGPVREFCLAAGATTEAYAPVEPSYRRPLPYLRASWKLARDFRRRGVRLVHCADVLAAHYCALAGKLAGVPVISHVRNRFEKISRRDGTFLYPVDRFVFVSKDTWRRFGYRVPESRGTVLYDGLETNEPRAGAGAGVREEFGIPPEARLIGMAARVAPQKDYRTLIEAAARVVASEPGVRFLIVGDYERVREHREHFALVEEWLRSAGMAPYFIFAGFRTDVARLLAALDIFVLSTNWEGLPLVILEAMACGKPVAATDVDGIPEIVRHGETGLLNPAGDASALAANLLSLMEPGRSAEFGAAGRRRVESDFSVERFAEGVRGVYGGMLGL